MTNEELCTLIQAGEDVSANMERLYTQNKGLIAKAARHFSGYGETEDLEQEGYFGLKAAAEQWKPDGGATFSSYAYLRLKAVMRRYLEESGSVIRLPSHQIARIVSYQKALTDFQSKYFRDPTAREMARVLNLTESQVEQIRKDAQILKPRSTSEGIGEDFTLGDTLENPENEIDGLLDQINREELANLLWSMVDELDDKESKVLRLRYKQNLTLKESGQELGCSIESVRATEQKALRKMRRPKNRRRLEPFILDRIYTMAYHTSLGSYRNTGISAQEKVILFLDERNLLREN